VLEHDGRSRIRDSGAQRVDVAVGHDDDVAGKRSEGILLGRLGREGERAHRAPVEAVSGNDELAAPCQPRQFEGCLVGLGT